MLANEERKAKAGRESVLESTCKTIVQYLPGKMVDHFYGYDRILEPMYHFTGWSFYRGNKLLFTHVSFYRNIIL